MGLTETEGLLPRLEELARRAAEPVGVDIAWVELKGEGQSCFFRVFIESDSGVGLEDCEQVSQRLGVLLEVEDPIESSYTLEVSTPGLDRPLWTKRDYQRFSGRQFDIGYIFGIILANYYQNRTQTVAVGGHQYIFAGHDMGPYFGLEIGANTGHNVSEALTAGWFDLIAPAP